MRKQPATEFISPAIKKWRATYLDLAALELLSGKLGVQHSNIIRLALHRMVDFEGLREKVAKKATLLARGRVAQAE